MEKGNLSIDSFSYKSYDRRFSDQDYILVVKDEDFPDKNVISILHRNAQKIEDIDEYDMGNKIFIVKDKYNPDILSLGERFSVNQLLKISSGNIIYNIGYEENPHFPKVKTFHSNLNAITNNEVIEIFEGKIDESKSRFDLDDPTLKALISDVYIGTSNCFFITENDKTMKGPFVAERKDSSEQIVIRTSEYMQFGEYDMNYESFIAFEANDIKRKIFIPGVNVLPAPRMIDFISDEDLLKDFEGRIKRSSNDYNLDILNSFIDFIRKNSTEVSADVHEKRNNRLLALINNGESQILSNIDFIH